MFHHIHRKYQVETVGFYEFCQICLFKQDIFYTDSVKEGITIFNLFIFDINGINEPPGVEFCQKVGILAKP